MYGVLVQRLRKDVSAWPDWVWKATPDELTAALLICRILVVKDIALEVLFWNLRTT